MPARLSSCTADGNALSASAQAQVRSEGACRGSEMKIRFSQPVVVGRELEYLRQAMEQGHLSSDGPFSVRCEAWLAARLDVTCAQLTHSASAALELAALVA